MPSRSYPHGINNKIKLMRLNKNQSYLIPHHDKERDTFSLTLMAFIF